MIVKLLVEIEKNLRNRIKERAAQEGRSMRDVVVDAIEAYLKTEKK